MVLRLLLMRNWEEESVCDARCFWQAEHADHEDEHGEELDGVALLGVVHGEQKGATQEDVERAGGGDAWAYLLHAAVAQIAGDEEGEIEQGECPRGDGLCGMVAVLPPAQSVGPHLSARVEEHVAKTREGQKDVVTERVEGDALLSELREFCVYFGVQVRQVVGAFDEIDGAVELLVAVEGAVGQAVGVERLVGVLPIELFGGCEVDGPGAIPALEAGGDLFAGIGCGTWGDGLEDVEGVPVAECPRNEWQKCEREYHDYGRKVAAYGTQAMRDGSHTLAQAAFQRVGENDGLAEWLYGSALRPGAPEHGWQKCCDEESLVGTQ